MSGEIGRKWIEAAKILCIDPAAVVRCPVCGEGDLKVTDVRCESLLERSMRCPSCGARNDILNPKR